MTNLIDKKKREHASGNGNFPARNASGAASWKPFAMLLGGLAVLAALTFISLTQGLSRISVATVIEAIVSPKDIVEHQIIHGVRFPRTIMGLISGASLAIAGALMQSVTRNPLASETTLGVNAGAYLVVVLGTLFFPGMLHQYSFPLAVLGGVMAALAVFGMGGGRRGTPVRIALSGMIVAMVLSSITSGLLMLFEEDAQGLFIWGSGSLVQNDWSGVRFAWPWVVGAIAIVLLAVRQLDLLSFSEETAQSLGQHVNRTRAFAMGIAIILACVSVSIVGPIGFIGLVAPHIVKLSGMTRHVWLLPTSALWGAAILVGADTVARSFARSAIGDLPAGAITALLGAPWIIWLALRTSRHLGGTGSSGDSTMNVGVPRRKISYPLLALLLAVVLVATCLIALKIGNNPMSVKEVLAALTGNGSSVNEKVIVNLRLPRLLTALLAGIALAASGSLMQSSLRNPLADPGIVGVTGGAGVGSLTVMLLFTQLSAAWIPLGAFVGGLAAAALVYGLAWRRGLNPTVLILIGIATAAVSAAIINILVIHAKLTLAPALAWMAGSTYARGWPEFFSMLPMVLVLVPIGWWLGRRVDLLAFRDESSQGLGLSIRSTRVIVGLISVLLASVAASIVGAIGFIGLLAPHVARMLSGPSHRRAMPLSMLFGGALLVGADLLGRILIAPKELPSGIVVALLGAPYLLYLMIRAAKAGR